MNRGDDVKFDATKNFTYVKSLGTGGTGNAYLFKDETTQMLFAIKKYVPKDSQFIDEYFARFVDEIKILFTISHPNIVRIYNYYLYPLKKTGYLQMEYVEGKPIDEFNPLNDGNKTWNDIFCEVISAFEYLEKHHILHRDIRPANILIDKDNHVKIIDFGFGKQYQQSNQEKNSILLNWPATEMPKEVVQEQEYNEQTEIYFVGTLFRHLLNGEPQNFTYNYIIEKMIKTDPKERYNSFSEIVSDISAGVLGEIVFSVDEKRIYQSFSLRLSNKIVGLWNGCTPHDDMQITLTRLADVLRKSALEETIQNNELLINCFISGRYRYNSAKDFPVKTVKDFYRFFAGLSPAKRKIVFDNICSRLSMIPLLKEDTDLPF